MIPRHLVLLALASLLPSGLAVSHFAWRSTIAAEGAQQDPLSEPFRGVTTDGSVETGLYAVRSTGVTTAPVREAAERFLDGLTDEQVEAVRFRVDDLEWRRWNNVHRAERLGVSFREMTETQRELGFDLLRAGLSAEGLEESRDIMRLNGYVAEVLDNYDEYGEDLYWLTLMGEPSATEPWGWQLDGHHLVVNYFVLGDQVVMTPTFMGSEPVSAHSGTYAGVEVLREEQDLGLAFIQALTPEQRARAVSDEPKTRGNAQSQAYRDNLILPYEGLRVGELDDGQREALMQIVAEYVGNMDDGHAAVKLDEVREHLDETYVLWIGETDDDAVFYYRIHSPVILIEFDHQGPVALEGERGVPTRRHVHTVVRTPNGNDYGKDLLRQHYEAHVDDPEHGHVDPSARGAR
jgi:hypothetical protein